MRKIKILLVGDTHGITELEWLPSRRYFKPSEWEEIPFWRYYFEAARDGGCDRIFQLGDFGFWEHMPEGVRYVDLVGNLAEEYGIPVYVLDGNHDKSSLVWESYPERDDEGFIVVRPMVKYAPRGHRWTWNERKFMAVGGAYSVDKGWRLDQESQRAYSLDRRNAYRALAGAAEEPYEAHGILWFPEEELSQAEYEEILNASEEPVDVMLTHDKPRQSNPGWNRKDLPDCLPNQDRISGLMRKFTPHLLVHGHLHYRYTDVVRCGDDGYFTQVEGLQCDPNAGVDIPGYSPEDSWLVLDVLPKDLTTTE